MKELNKHTTRPRNSTSIIGSDYYIENFSLENNGHITKLKAQEKIYIMKICSEKDYPA